MSLFVSRAHSTTQPSVEPSSLLAVVVCWVQMYLFTPSAHVYSLTSFLTSGNQLRATSQLYTTFCHDQQFDLNKHYSVCTSHYPPNVIVICAIVTYVFQVGFHLGQKSQFIVDLPVISYYTLIVRNIAYLSEHSNGLIWLLSTSTCT